MVACDSSGSSEATKPECGPLEDGTYRFRITPESNDCGDTEPQETLVQVSGGDAVTTARGPGCTTIDQGAVDECVAEGTWECDFPGEGIIATYTAEIEGRTTEAAGDVYIVIHDRETNALLCSGIYRATWEKNTK